MAPTPSSCHIAVRVFPVHGTLFPFRCDAVTCSSRTAALSMQAGVHLFPSRSDGGDECFSWALPLFPSRTRTQLEFAFRFGVWRKAATLMGHGAVLSRVVGRKPRTIASVVGCRGCVPLTRGSCARHTRRLVLVVRRVRRLVLLKR